MFCRSLFDLLNFFFWSLSDLLRYTILISPLVSSIFFLWLSIILYFVKVVGVYAALPGEGQYLLQVVHVMRYAHKNDIVRGLIGRDNTIFVMEVIKLSATCRTISDIRGYDYNRLWTRKHSGVWYFFDFHPVLNSYCFIDFKIAIYSDCFTEGGRK
jgi:hypothetical protein